MQENLQNIRIFKFSIALYAMIYESLRDTIKLSPNNLDLNEFLLSLWALISGISIEYKHNHITYLDRDAYTSASAIESFVFDLIDEDTNLFVNQNSSEDQTDIEDDKVKIIRSIFKKYVKRHNLPLVQSVQVFDLVTAGISIDKKIIWRGTAILIWLTVRSPLLICSYSGLNTRLFIPVSPGIKHGL